MRCFGLKARVLELKQVGAKAEGTAYSLLVVDEAHHVFGAGGAEAVRGHLDCAMRALLLSDASQMAERTPRYPPKLDTPEAKVYLTEVVRSSQRIATAATAFQLRNGGERQTTSGARRAAVSARPRVQVS